MSQPHAHPHDHTHGSGHDHAGHAGHDHAGHDHGGHGHGPGGHRHHHVDHAAGDLRVALAVGVNVLLTVAQIVGGLLAGSLSLVADALHNLSDAMSLLIAFAARKIARRASDETMTFGYGRVELVAALVNYTSLAVIGLWLGGEAIWRFFEPQAVEGWIVVVVAGIALVIDAATALLVFAMSKTSANMRAAFLHNVADALGSVAVMVAGILILLFDWRLADPIITLLMSGYIVYMAVAEVGGVIRVLMLGAPAGVKTADVVAAVRAVDGVQDVHRTRFWLVGENESAFDAHIVIDAGAWNRADAIKAAIKAALAERFGIASSTLELECAAHACLDAPAYGGP